MRPLLLQRECDRKGERGARWVKSNFTSGKEFLEGIEKESQNDRNFFENPFNNVLVTI
jgi:hypothetical protein